jgi:hypothetical protein
MDTGISGASVARNSFPRNRQHRLKPALLDAVK